MARSSVIRSMAFGDLTGRCERSGVGELDEPAQDPLRFRDGCRHEPLGQRVQLARREVSVVAVHLRPGHEVARRRLGVELRGVHAAADPIHLHGASGRRREEHGVVGQPIGGLLVACEGVETFGQDACERVGDTFLGERDLDRGDGLGPLWESQCSALGSVRPFAAAMKVSRGTAA